MRLDIEKATQALNFFVRQEGPTIDKMKALKLVFFADRYHLRMFGRPVTRDRYVAMEYGPVASSAFDLVNNRRAYIGAAECDYAHHYLRPIANARGQIVQVASAHDPELDVFSESDLEALAFSYREFGEFSGRDLSMITHVYPEWARHRQALLAVRRVDMDYLDFFNDPDPEECAALNFSDPFQGLTDEEHLEVSKEVYLDHLRLEGMMAV